ncbi:MAG: site-2 protease family protein [Spirosomataceae bacterium]
MNRRQRTYLLQAILFIATLITTTIAGAEWTWGSSFLNPFREMGWTQFWSGTKFSVPFLAILTIHEFGHYFTAKYNRIKVTLPFYIPIWLGPVTSIGTMGAFIRIKSKIKSARGYFDVGIAGPLAGFVAAIGLLWYGFTHLPSLDYLFTIHPEYKQFGSDYAAFVYQSKQAGNVALGDNLVFWFFKKYVVTDPKLIPSPYEIIHYPYLFAGYLALFFTALNLIPIGQLDGGHILYALIGSKRHRVVSPVLFVLFITYAGIGTYRIEDFAIHDNGLFLEQVGYAALYIFFLFYSCRRTVELPINAVIMALSIFLAQLLLAMVLPHLTGNSVFLPFTFVLGRFLGVYHPPAEDEAPLDWKRQILGWLALLIFVVCMSPEPFLMD